ncbi:MAG: C25 family cysteine peptidase [Acidobacteriota bacterium]
MISLLLALALPTATPAAPLERIRFQIETATEGVYRVTYEDLTAAGLSLAFLPSSALRLRQGDTIQPIRRLDGDDGRFGPGDRLEFVARRLAGDFTYHHGWADRNVYWLETHREGSPSIVESAAQAGGRPTPLRGSIHLEEEEILLRFPRETLLTDEGWYWKRLSHLDREPFAMPIRLPHLDAASSRPVTLRLRFRGWSKVLQTTPPQPGSSKPDDHRVEVLLDGRVVGEGRWNNHRDGYLLSIEGLSARAFQGGEARLALRVPRRGPEDQPLVDVSALDWIELDYPRIGQLARSGRRITPENAPATVRADPNQPVAVWSDDGQRISLPAGEGHFRLPSFPSFFTVADDTLRTPERITVGRPPRLRSEDRGADYIAVVHPRLRKAVQPLIQAHRQRGLRVEIVGIGEIWHEFGGGVPHPRALREFLAYAHHHWHPPAPRFVLLVGDASWDTRNPVIRKQNYAELPYAPGRGLLLGTNRAQTYSDQPYRNRRNLIPTASYGSLLGHAATDNWFVAFGEDDLHPQMAIGRFPVVEEAEVAAIVAKTLRALDGPPPGPERREVVWISDGNSIVESTNRRLIRQLTARGFTDRRIRPQASDASPAERRERLLAAFDSGPPLIHFIGHGGRNIWRTGLSEEEALKDLFTLEDLDRLQAQKQSPIVLSMSCYSAPFDHPNVDSIGEKMLRLENRGAVAVLAASSRNSPSFRMSWTLLRELLDSDTLGEAIQIAKGKTNNRDFIEQYNLLGDPALPVGLAAADLVLREATTLAGRERAVYLSFGETRGTPAQGMLEWLGAGDEVIFEQAVELRRDGAIVAFAGPPERASRVRAVRAYLWNPDSGADGAGRLQLMPNPPPRRLAARNLPEESPR